MNRDMVKMLGTENPALEAELKAEWRNWENKCHPDDSMSFIDYCDEVSRFKGNLVVVDYETFGDVKILFLDLDN